MRLATITRKKDATKGRWHAICHLCKYDSWFSATEGIEDAVRWVADHLNWHHQRIMISRNEIYSAKDKQPLLVFIEGPQWSDKPMKGIR